MKITRKQTGSALGLALWLCAGAAQAQEAGADARTHFAQGAALFERNNYDAALTEFERAYELGTANPNRYVVLFNIGQCHERMFRYELALRYYRQYLEQAPPTTANRATVEATVNALEGLLATLRIRVNVPRAEVWVDDRRVGEAPGDVRVPGGRHVVELRASGHSPARQEVQVPARDTRELTFALEQLSQRRGISPVFFWSAAGATALCAGLTVAFGVQVTSARSDVDARLANSAARFDVTEDDRANIQRLALTTDIFVAGAALFGVGTGILFFLTQWHSPAATPSGPRAMVTPTLSPSATGLQLTGSF